LTIDLIILNTNSILRQRHSAVSALTISLLASLTVLVISAKLMCVVMPLMVLYAWWWKGGCFVSSHGSDSAELDLIFDMKNNITGSNDGERCHYIAHDAHSSLATSIPSYLDVASVSFSCETSVSYALIDWSYLFR
jgi:hypothetical protein